MTSNTAVASASPAVRFARTAIALACAAVLAACQTPGTANDGAHSHTAHSQAAQQREALRVDIAKGLYEVAYLPQRQELFVAATPSFDKGTPGYVYRLDADTLAIKQTIELERRAFALGLNAKTGTLYVGNTLDGSLTVVDAASGTVKGVIQLAQPNEKGEAPHTRKVIVDEANNLVFVTNPDQQGRVWIVDGNTGALVKTFEQVGKWSTGAAFDTATGRLYVGHGGTQEIVVIDTQARTIVQRFDSGEPDGHFFINLTLDAKGQRLFASDANKGEVAVFDTTTGKVVKTVPVGKGVLDILFNPARQEIYVTNRGVTRSEPNGTGQLTVIDAGTYAVKRTLDLPVHPNSLALSPSGDTLYVSVKAPHRDSHPAFKAGALDSVLSLPL